MAQINFTIPDAELPRLINALATAFKYSDTIIEADGSLSPNPETKAQFAKRMTITWWRNIVKAMEVQAAKKAAEDTYIGTATDIDVS